jgi:glutamate dehydrogenase
MQITSDEPQGVGASLRDRVSAALVEGALPGELTGFVGRERDDAAGFVAELLSKRAPHSAAVRIESISGEDLDRRMRLGVINDDMPFLVDSIAGAIASRGLEIHRLLHPIVPIRRAEDGTLTAILAPDAVGERNESVVYVELERADARVRRTLVEEIGLVLGDVRAAVADWAKMQDRLRSDADALPDGEGAALLRWFLDRQVTLLGHQVERRDGAVESPLGILRQSGPWLWSNAARDAAFAHFAAGGDAPLMAKSDRVSTVHRRVQIDLIILPVRDADTVVGVSIHAVLWTSAALAAPADRVPVLRSRLRAIEEKYGFSPRSHAGKALRHALSALPHDITVAMRQDVLEAVALTAMSLADRPRPKLILSPGPLGRFLFAFVWLPRDELSTKRRVQVGEMIAEALGARVASWSVEVGDGDLAAMRYTIDLPPQAVVPDAEGLDRRLAELVRGWNPAVEAALVRAAGANRAARLGLTYAAAFPQRYRDQYGPEEAARDILRLSALESETARGVRLYRAVGDQPGQLRLKTYRLGGSIALSDAVPAFENFGFRVIEELPTELPDGLGNIHDFKLELAGGADTSAILKRAAAIEEAIAAVLGGSAENDLFNTLLIDAGLATRDTVQMRAWTRYLRQTGMAYGLATVVAALRRSPEIARGIIALFEARHAPTGSAAAIEAADAALDAALPKVIGIDDDRILRRLRAVVAATLRTNAFAPASAEALAFKLDSAAIPGLPRPVPWREIWVYSPRIEGIHLRGGPIARGGLRWSDRRDDFRTEILGLMKAQLVKNAVIIPTGAKGGFYPKLLPPASDRDAWLAEGTESYRVFIRALLSVTDNIVEGAIVHPEGVVIRDGDDPYFVVAADKGTASFSDTANAIALERGFWLGDAFASGGSQGYDHKAMGITAKGAWVSVQRHLAEMGVDVQVDPVTVAGCGDMSGDVFGNGMLLSKTLRLIAAFDHRHIFLDPDPDPVASWTERSRLFALPRSSWADYDATLISAGGGIFARTQKEIPISAAAAAALGIASGSYDPSMLINAILKAPVDLLWFGGIGTYIKAADENHVEVADPANDAHRVNGRDVRAKVVGEGANLGVTQAGRIEFAGKGGRINTDFIDNSAGVDCSDNEVNIKIPLNREMIEGRLGFEDRNALLREMTDEVARLVLEDNRLQTLALSLAERGGAAALPAQVRVIETLEATGRIDRGVEGLGSNEDLLRRAQDGHGLTRPELAVILAHGKIALQAAIEASTIPDDPAMRPILFAAFPVEMQERQTQAIEQHRLRREIIATKVANRVVNRLGLTAPFELAEEEGVSLAQVVTGYLAAEALFDLPTLWLEIESAPIAEQARLTLLTLGGIAARLHSADIVRASAGVPAGDVVAALRPGIERLNAAADDLLKEEALLQASALRVTMSENKVPAPLAARVVRLFELDGAVGTAALARRLSVDEVSATSAYIKLGEALGLDWAKAAAARFASSDPWERLLLAGLARDFEQLRLDFLSRSGGGDPERLVDLWLAEQAPRIDQFRKLVTRARGAATPSAAMLAQIGTQARLLLAR